MYKKVLNGWPNTNMANTAVLTIAKISDIWNIIWQHSQHHFETVSSLDPIMGIVDMVGLCTSCRKKAEISHKNKNAYSK